MHRTDRKRQQVGSRGWLTDEVALCVLTRIKICFDNVKNPFDDCERDPTK